MKELEKLITHENNNLLNVILQANFNHWIWWIYVGPDRVEYFALFREYQLFFSNSTQAHFLSLIVSLYKLYDRNKRTNNFRRLHGLIRNNNLLSADESHAIKERYERAYSLWEKVRILRNKYFAHLEIDIELESLYEEVGITPNELKELITLSMEILNLIRRHYGKAELSLISPERDVRRLLSALRTGKDTAAR